MEDVNEKLLKENKNLKERLGEAEDTLEAIRTGEVDAIVVKGPTGDQLYSLVSTDRPYQVFIETMGEAAIVLSKEGTILYANAGFFEMVGYLPESVIGVSILNFIQENQQATFMETILKERKGRQSFVWFRKISKSLQLPFLFLKEHGKRLKISVY